MASLSGAVWQNVPPDDLDLLPEKLLLISENDYFHRAYPDTVLPGIDLPPPGKHFAGAFGDPFDARFFNSVNVFSELGTLLKNDRPMPAVFLTVGDDDSHGLLRGTFALFITLRADQQAATLRVTGGDHTWSVWRESIGPALIFLDGQRTTKP